MRLKLVGRIDGANGGTMTVDRKRGLVSVRPKYCRREYVLPATLVAEIIVARVVKAELAK